jgi:hypothetical protein
MGLGKSSVIVPIDAVALADGTQLVRVVVLKPLAMQMFQLLAAKLGGMLNRRIVYMPFSGHSTWMCTKHGRFGGCMKSAKKLDQYLSFNSSISSLLN